MRSIIFPLVLLSTIHVQSQNMDLHVVNKDTVAIQYIINIDEKPCDEFRYWSTLEGYLPSNMDIVHHPIVCPWEPAFVITSSRGTFKKKWTDDVLVSANRYCQEWTLEISWTGKKYRVKLIEPKYKSLYDTIPYSPTNEYPAVHGYLDY